MLAEVFYWLFNMSVAGSLVGCILLLVRRIRRLPRGIVYFLWVIPFLRLWIPFGLAGRLSIFRLFPNAAFHAVQFPESQLLAMNFAQAAEEYFPIVFKSSPIERVFAIGALVWLIVFAACCIALLWSYLLGKSEVRSAELLKKGIYCSPNVTAPAVYGFFRPRIVFPQDFPKEAFEYAVKHEQAHIARCDNLFRCVALVTACLHWFNPLCWVFLKYFFEDMELACDARVLKALSEEEQKEYARSLLTAAAGKSLFVSAFGGARIRVRLEYALSYRKLTALAGIACAVFVAAIALALLLNAPGGVYVP